MNNSHAVLPAIRSTPRVIPLFNSPYCYYYIERKKRSLKSAWLAAAADTRHIFIGKCKIKCKYRRYIK
jgi:hypothetical protein